MSHPIKSRLNQSTSSGHIKNLWNKACFRLNETISAIYYNVQQLLWQLSYRKHRISPPIRISTTAADLGRVLESHHITTDCELPSERKAHAEKIIPHEAREQISRLIHTFIDEIGAIPELEALRVKLEEGRQLLNDETTNGALNRWFRGMGYFGDPGFTPGSVLDLIKEVRSSLPTPDTFEALQSVIDQYTSPPKHPSIGKATLFL